MTSSFRTVPADIIIPTLPKVGSTEVELMSNHAEALAGAPIAPWLAAAPAGPPPALNTAGLLPRRAAMPLIRPLITSGPGIVLPPPTPNLSRYRLFHGRRLRLRTFSGEASGARHGYPPQRSQAQPFAGCRRHHRPGQQLAIRSGRHTNPRGAAPAETRSLGRAGADRVRLPVSHHLGPGDRVDPLLRLLSRCTADRIMSAARSGGWP